MPKRARRFALDKPTMSVGVGLRSYIACRILEQNGFDARNLSGGYTTYRAMTKTTCGEAVPALGPAGILPAVKNKGKMPSPQI